TLLLAVRQAARLLEHPRRGRVVVEPARGELRAIQLVEGESHEPARGFGGVALTPIGLAQPIAEFPTARRMNPAGADIGAGRFAQNAERQILPACPAMCRADDE